MTKIENFIFRWSNFKIYSLGSHTDSIVSCFFEKNSLDLISISKNGQMCVWESSMETNDFKQIEAPPSKKQVFLFSIYFELH